MYKMRQIPTYVPQSSKYFLKGFFKTNEKPKTLNSFVKHICRIKYNVNYLQNSQFVFRL